MSALTLNSILAATYGAIDLPPAPTRHDTALLLIDVQTIASPAYLRRKAIAKGLDAAAVDAALADYAARFNAALQRCQAVLQAARAARIPAVHVKIEAQTADARDTSPLHRRMGWLFPPGSEEGAFLSEAAPLPGEVVVTKTASGAFNGTSLDRVLRNMGIHNLFVCGFMIDECVETTVRVGLDLGYLAVVIADATTAYQREVYDYTIGKFGWYGLARSADEVMAAFAAMPAS
jgi:nicotinamidase-related amidase